MTPEEIRAIREMFKRLQALGEFFLDFVKADAFDASDKRQWEASD